MSTTDLPSEDVLASVRARRRGESKPHVFTYRGSRWLRFRRGPFMYVKLLGENR